MKTIRSSATATSRSVPEAGVSPLRGTTTDYVAWRSWMGFSSALFLVNGVILLVSAIGIPLALHLNGAGGTNGLLMSSGDDVFLGRHLADLRHSDPRLDAFLVDFMDTMCAFMLVSAVMQFGITWFAFRLARWWAYWTLAIADVIWAPFYAIVVVNFARMGAPVGPGLALLAFYFSVPLLAGLLGFYAMRRLHASGQTESHVARPRRAVPTTSQAE